MFIKLSEEKKKIGKYTAYVDNMEKKRWKNMLEKLKDKYIFFDVDGTLSEYRFKDKLYGGGCPEFGCQSLEDLLFSDLFYRARPLKTMQNIVSKLESEKIYVIRNYCD